MDQRGVAADRGCVETREVDYLTGPSLTGSRKERTFTRVFANPDDYMGVALWTVVVFALLTIISTLFVVPMILAGGYLVWAWD